MIFTGFSITPYSVNHMLEALNILKHMLRRPNQIYSSSIYWYLNTLCGLNKLPIKNLSLQEAFFSELSNTVNKNVIFNTKHAEFSIKRLLLFHISPPYLFTQSPYSPPISAKFHLAISTPFLSFHLTIPTIPTNTPFRYTSAIFCFPIFA